MFWLKRTCNHYPLTDSAYNATKDLKAFGKTVRYAGKTLLVAGVALDVLELGMSIDIGLKDADCNRFAKWSRSCESV